jgi:F-type H+-transporting ATPase subunit delta
VKNMVIARRYAKALLLVGKEDGNAETYKKELDGISSLIDGNKELEQAIINPLYDSAKRKNVLQKIIEKLEISQGMTFFLLLLFDKGRIGFLSSINEFYKKLADELKGIVRANLTSAAELSSDTIDKIKLALSKKTGKDIILEVQQDPGLIGGVVTKIGDLVLDGSVKTQLLNMRESLKRGESV